MKFFVTNLALFVVFTIAFSSLNGCKNTTVESNAGNPPTQANTNTQAGSANQSTYPPLVSAVADADFELTDGTKTKITDRKGKVVLINLWGIWCGPCRAEMPHLVELQDKYRDQGLQIIGLNVGDEDGQPESLVNIKAFGEKTKLNYELARAPREMTNQIYLLSRFEAVPQSLLVDRDGHLRAVLRGGGPTSVAQLKESVDRAMAQ